MTPEQKDLLHLARSAAKKAYAPYSGFRVGAAVLTEKGVFTGANIENSSTNLGVCAERVAIAHARMHDARNIAGVAVYCIDTDVDAANFNLNHTLPCGGCRQWLAELAPDCWLISNGSERVFALDELLPNPFILK